MKQHFVLFTVFLLLLAVATPAFGQRLDGTIRGTVLDPSGAAVPDAKITVTNVDTGTVQKTTTSSVGAYTFPNLLIGPYSVTVEAPKYQTYKRTNVQVMAAQIIEVDAKLTIGSSTEIVEVAAGADVVQTESSQLTTTFSFRTVQDVPSTFGANGFLSVQNLAVFAPNTTTQLGGTSGNGGSIGGLRGRQNSFTIDGTNNNDNEVSTSSLEVMPDAVAEFSLSTNMFAAEYGNAAGGQFNIVTKSGTNTPHGSFFWYNNNRKLNAWDNQEKLRGAHDRFDYNRLGVNVGGPIIKNKLFFFGAYQFQATGSKGSAPTASAPTSAGYTALNGIAVDQQVKDLMAQFPVAAGASGTPQTVCRRANRVTKTADPADVCVQVPFGALSAVAPSFLNNNQYIVNVDWNINEKHQLRGRQIFDRVRGPSLGAFPQAQFTANTATDNRKMIIDEVWNISNTMINDFKATGSRLNTNSGVFQNPIAATYPTVQFTGIVTVGPANNLPQYRITNTYQLADSLSWVKGKHSFKFGANYDWFTGPSNFLQNSRGQLAYVGFEEFINDFVPSTNGTTLQGIGSGNFSQNRHNIGAYAQDDFKLNPRLTLNLGVRYDFFGVFKGGQNNALDSVANCPECGSNPFFPLIWTTIGDDYNNFAPRIGAAWDPTGSGKWAVRGGFGMGYDILPGNFYLNGQPPQYQAVLNPQTACAGALGTKPGWCPAAGLPSTSTANYLGNGAMSGITFTPPSTSAFARSLTGNLLPPNTSPIVYTWSAGVQREVMRNTLLEVRYLGTKATKLPIQTQINSLTAFANGAKNLPVYFSASEIPGTADASAGTRAQFNTSIVRPYAGNGFSGVITTYAPEGHSRYDGLSVDFSRRATKGLTLRANYTWSNAHDNATNDLFTSTVNPRRPQDFRNLDSEWSRSALDVQNKVAVTWVYEVPKANVGDNAFGRAFLHGWQVSGSYLFQGGQPVTVLSGVDSNGNGDSAPDRAIINPNGTERSGTLVNRVCRNPNTNTTAVGSAAACPVFPGFTTDQLTVGYVAQDPTAKYVQAQLGALATAGRNTENSGHFNVFNLAFAKNTAIKESWSLQFRADLFNAFNHRNFTLGSTSIFGTNTNASSTTYSNLSASTVGSGASTVSGKPLFLNDQQFNGGSRTIQLGLRLIF
jgi:outer membrane receptor protein involved in Fe transport